MKSVSGVIPRSTSDQLEVSAKGSFIRPVLVALLLLVICAVLAWLPLAETESTSIFGSVLLLFWCFGGFSTLALLAFAGRKA